VAIQDDCHSCSYTSRQPHRHAHRGGRWQGLNQTTADWDTLALTARRGARLCAPPGVATLQIVDNPGHCQLNAGSVEILFPGGRDISRARSLLARSGTQGPHTSPKSDVQWERLEHRFFKLTMS